jgi:hypothetical protein
MTAVGQDRADDSVLYDTPLEFMSEVAERSGECMAQSVIPQPDGRYLCACSCEQWEVTTPSREEGLRLARQHTGTGGH